MHGENSKRADEISLGVWMVGLGLLFFTGYWWPGILFVAAAGTAVHSVVDGRGWYALQGSLWLVGLGLWFASGAKVWILFVILGVSAILTGLFRPPFLSRKPYVDNSLE